MRRSVLLVVVACLSAAASSSAAPAKKGTAPPPPAAPAALSPRDIADRVLPTVFTVVGTNGGGQGVGQGSGFLIGPRLLVTNHHVVAEFTDVRIKALDREDFVPVVGVVAEDPDHDLVLLALREDMGVPLALATEEVRHGDHVFAVGAPHGLEATFTDGMVSGLRGDDRYLQISAPISPGSSGGPVVNDRAEVVGVVFAKHKAVDAAGFAIPVRFVRELEAKKTEPRPLGAARASTAMEGTAPVEDPAIARDADDAAIWIVGIVVAAAIGVVALPVVAIGGCYGCLLCTACASALSSTGRAAVVGPGLLLAPPPDEAGAMPY